VCRAPLRKGVPSTRPTAHWDTGKRSSSPIFCAVELHPPCVFVMCRGDCELPVDRLCRITPSLCTYHMQGVLCTAYSPLGGPNLVKPNDLINNPTVAKVAAQCNKTPAQVPCLFRIYVYVCVCISVCGCVYGCVWVLCMS